MVALRKTEFEGARPVPSPQLVFDEISSHLLIDETRLVGGLIERAVFTDEERRRTSDVARRLVHAARASHMNHSGVDAFMREYGLSSEEGVILMCLA
jgi:RHH-type proline utilization regulon transcriptional repressor/proline dehydrogenase/delta 1-pyrroline-5-carboxylate dehydrogenase